MLDLHPKFIKDDEGNAVFVVISVAEFEEIKTVLSNILVPAEPMSKKMRSNVSASSAIGIVRV